MSDVTRLLEAANAASFLVKVEHTDGAVLASRARTNGIPIARRQVKMPPTIALTDPGEGALMIDPLASIVVEIDPGPIALGQNDSHLASCRFREQHVFSILELVHSADYEFLKRLGPLHTGDVEIGAGIDGDIDTSGCTARGRNDTDPTS